jgi:sec-independent protein translocase protein TatC
MADANSQSFIEHLVDLRTCIIRSAWIIIIGFAVCVYFSDKIFDIIRAPIVPYLGPSGGLVFTAPIDKFTSYLKVSFMAGAIITCPAWLYQVWLFVAPGLYKKEKKMAAYFIFFGSLLFAVGVLFVYKIVYPMAFKYLLTFGGTVDKPMITITEYLSFFITTTLIFGLAFEMPLILAVLAAMGVVDDTMLRSKRRVAYMIIAVVAAVITPPDAISMLSMLGPMILLYEISIIIVGQIVKSQAAKNKI